MRKILNRLVDATPAAHSGWTCPYFLAILGWCSVCIVFGVLAGGLGGVMIAAAGGFTAGIPVGHRVLSAEEVSCPSQ